ncbi:ATP-binding protein [Actinoplanes sp. NEAU-A12]|uniref:ATP-binding protein n=1 Tax=Actinoplanes sandaracinus TaxID=3045177 RepID=A0ABT6WXC0_9ACTN|nr:ATP-binding protein [Actinoplanes sandaracinus]MDI6104344.1 ATP-binding protein [Actinoplanes sandaracinus]
MAKPDPSDISGPTVRTAISGSAGMVLRQPFDAATVTAARHLLASTVAEAGLTGDSADDVVLAVNELVTNAVRHGGGTGVLEVRVLDDVLVCEVIDSGTRADGLPVRLSAVDVPGGRGLWLAHHLTGTLVLTRRPDGVTASVTVCLCPEPPSATVPAEDNSAAPEPAKGDS